MCVFVRGMSLSRSAGTCVYVFVNVFVSGRSKCVCTLYIREQEHVYVSARCVQTSVRVCVCML